jgi:hypothetical protein
MAHHDSFEHGDGGGLRRADKSQLGDHPSRDGVGQALGRGRG